MLLSKYIAKTRGNGKLLSDALRIPPSYLSQMASGYRPVSPVMAIRIEKATAGQVSRKDLRSDWRFLWPELAGSTGTSKLRRSVGSLGARLAGADE